MTKLNRETQLRRGEQLLNEWAVAPSADVQMLRAVSSRDPAADLAVAARLGAHAEPAAVEALLALEASSTDKLVRKEVRRSLYRLEQRGLTVSQPPPAAAPRPVLAPALEGYVSAIDGNGDQLVWLLKPRAGGLSHVFAVINDPDGLREVELLEITRKALRESQQELLRKHELRMVEADWRYCDHLISRAWQWSEAHGRQVSGDYPGIRAQLIKESATDLPPLIFRYLDPQTVRGDANLLAQSARLLEEKEFRTWFFDRTVLQPYIDETLQIRDSPLVLNPAQQQERLRALSERAVEELFGGGRQPSWVRRLEEMAYFFHATGRPEQAKLACVVALALERSTRGGRDIPFCEQLVGSSLTAHLQLEQQREEEQARSSLVVTPQQAARAAQRQR